MSRFGLQVHPFFLNNPQLKVFPISGDFRYPPQWPKSELTGADIARMVEAGHPIVQYGWIIPPNWMVFDIDMHDVDGRASWLQLLNDFGWQLDESKAWVCNTAGCGWHIVIPWPDAGMFTRKSLEAYPGVDFLRSSPDGKARFIVAAGSLPNPFKGAGGQPGEYAGGTLLPAAGDWAVPPAALVEALRIEKSEPVARNVERVFGTPVDEFNTSAEGLEILIATMTHAGYELVPAGDRFGWCRPGKQSASDQNGYVGHISSDGRYQLTCFTTQSEHFPAWDDAGGSNSITIAQAMVHLRHGQQIGQEQWAETVKFLAGFGFGRRVSAESFGDVAGSCQPLPPPGEGAAASQLPAPVVESERPVSERPWLMNYHIEGEGKNAARIPHSPDQLLADLGPIVGLISLQGSLVYVQRVGAVDVRIHPIKTAAKLFALIQTMRPVRWTEAEGAVTKAEFYGVVEQVAPRYESISITPHFPACREIYYPIPELSEPGDPQDFWNFVRHFSAASEEDLWLIAAMMLTPFWGGDGGRRPVWLITGAGGSGSGKSTLMEALARLLGLGRLAATTVNDRKQFDELPKRLGSRSPVNPIDPRLIAVDNFEGARLGGAIMESLTTAEMLDLYKLYVGDVSVVNRYTVIATGNYLDLSSDFGNRTIEIKLARPEWSAEWIQKLREFDLVAVIRGIAAILQGPKNPVTRTIRYVDWCHEVLGRLPAGAADALVGVIEERQSELTFDDDDHSQAYEILQHVFGQWQSKEEPRMIGDKLAMTATEVVALLSKSDFVPPTGRWTTRSLSRMLRPHLDPGNARHIPELEFIREGGTGRKYWLWPKA